jgi:transcriptional regulator GlxA family with amidase domain
VSARRSIGFLLYEGCLATDVVGPADLFHCFGRQTALPAGALPYDVHFLAARPGLVSSHGGLRLAATASLAERLPGLDTLFIPGGEPLDRRRLLADAATVAAIRAAAGSLRRLASICTGAFILAELGLLNGRRATTHWLYAGALHRIGGVSVQPDSLFVQDGNIHTSAGITAGMDLALAMIEADHGRRAALELARLFVLQLKRPGGQSQFSVELQAQIDAPDPFGRLLDWLRDHLHEPLSVDRLAAEAAMSPRNFARRFTLAFGVTPARFVERLRVDRACALIDETALPLATIAGQAGLGDAQHLRRAFRRHLGVTPQLYAVQVRGHPAPERPRGAPPARTTSNGRI